MARRKGDPRYWQKAHQVPVATGDLFRRTGRNRFGHRYPTWQVVSVSRGSDGVWHAELQLIQDPTDRKKVSVEALMDRRLYESD